MSIPLPVTDLKMPTSSDLSECAIDAAIGLLTEAGADMRSVLLVCGIGDAPAAREAINYIHLAHYVEMQVNPGKPCGEWELCAVSRDRLFVVRNSAP